MTLDQLHDYAVEYARGFFNTFGELPPTFFALDAKDQIHLLIVSRYTQHREKYAMLLGSYFIHHDIQKYAHVAEAWMAQVPRAEADKPLTPSKHPSRREVLSVGAIDEDGMRMSIVPIERPEDGRARLGETSHRGVTDSERREVTHEGLNGLFELIRPVRAHPMSGQIAKAAVELIIDRGVFDKVVVYPAAETARPKYQD